jgi:hypothetical protein
MHMARNRVRRPGAKNGTDYAAGTSEEAGVNPACDVQSHLTITEVLCLCEMPQCFCLPLPAC